MYYWDGPGPTSNRSAGIGQALNLPPYWRQHWAYDFEDNSHEAVVPTDFNNVSKDWLLTAYRRDRAPEDQILGRDPRSPDGKSTGAEQLGSLDVPTVKSKAERLAERAGEAGGSAATAIQVKTNKDFRALPKGTWVEFNGKRFPKR